MNNFEYIQPKSIDDAGAILKKNASDSIACAGGTDVLGMIKNNLISPSRVVNLKAVNGLSEIKYVPGKEITIGSLVTLKDIAESRPVREKFTALAEAAQKVASPQFRNIATIGGNICQRPRCHYFRSDLQCIRKGGGVCYAYDGNNKYHCITGGGPCYIVHPSDAAVALLALGAKVSIRSEGKSRAVPFKEFFVLPETDPTVENILKPGEILESIIIPEPKAGYKSAFVKFMEREAWDFAVVSVAVLSNIGGGKINNAEFAFGGIAPVPWSDVKINASMKGVDFSEEAIKKETDKMFGDAEILGMNKYKIPLVRNLTKRILLDSAD